MLGIMKILHTPKQHQQFEVAGKRHGDPEVQGRGVCAVGGGGCDGLGAAASLLDEGDAAHGMWFFFSPAAKGQPTGCEVRKSSNELIK
jgi:hypothetical protein